MSSLRRKLSSRANGSRSKGLKTLEGKRRSAANAIRHGLLSKHVVLDNETTPAYNALVASYTARFALARALESGMIEELASSYWHLRRGWAIETSLMNSALSNQPFAADKKGEVARTAAAFCELAQSPELALLHRYETVFTTSSSAP